MLCTSSLPTLDNTEQAASCPLCGWVPSPLGVPSALIRLRWSSGVGGSGWARSPGQGLKPSLLHTDFRLEVRRLGIRGLMSESLQSQALVAISTLVDREDDANSAQPEAAYQLPVLG